jgi:hypothetical protein
MWVGIEWTTAVSVEGEEIHGVLLSGARWLLPVAAVCDMAKNPSLVHREPGFPSWIDSGSRERCSSSYE